MPVSSAWLASALMSHRIFDRVVQSSCSNQANAPVTRSEQIMVAKLPMN